MSELTKEQFLKHLRNALNHLRDPNYLRQSPLASLFGVASRPDTPMALRQIVIEAVKSLRPEDSEPAQSPAWRLYESLFYRYVQYFSQLEVADQLGISPRQLRREQRAALETLTHQLWQQFDIEARLREDKEGMRITTPQEEATNDALYEDLAWLKDAPPETPTDLNQELPAVLELARSLAARHRVELSTALDDVHSQLAANPVAFRQTLLSLLGVAIPRASCSRVRMSTRALPGEVEIEIRCEKPPSGPHAVSEGEKASLNMACRLAELCGGGLIVDADDRTFSARLILPALGQLPVLAIDDNVGTLNLLQRYVAGTRYRLIGTQDPEQALSLAEQVLPQIIVLDVMMPSVDGWEILGRLRQHPLTSHVPVVVCTILPEEELAFSLGASGFVRKPVTRQAFLAALDRQLEQIELRTGTKSH